MAKIKTGIIGGAGYTGGELIRILGNHPDAIIDFVHSKSNAGKYLYEVHEDLLGDTDQRFTSDLNQVDVLFLCMAHGEAKKFLEDNEPIIKNSKIIDLSQDYRLLHQGQKPVFRGLPFIYGLPELNREQIKTAHHIANPGCFATAIQLGLLPLAKAGLLAEIHSTGITGSTGAGQGLSGSSHFSWRTNNIQAYKTLTHQHIKEIHQSLHSLQASPQIECSFIPWRGDFARGIFISSQISCAVGEEELTRLYRDFYKEHPFTFLSSKPIFLKQVVNTNKAVIQLEKIGNKLVIHSVIDNLLKGASGQAVQNMNLMFGLGEKTGLNLKGSAF
jgi:N-acetyl-gamma-glutamyl-phosphate reductase